MSRREFVALAGAGALALPRVAFGQAAAGKVPRIAWLSIPQPPQYLAALQAGLAGLGWVDGKSIAIEQYVAPTNGDLPALAAKAVASAPDILFPLGTPASQAAKTATSTLPIVFAIVADPIVAGLVTSLAHPAGNITGNTNQAPGVVGKQMSILKELMPSLHRLAILNIPGDAAAALQDQQAVDGAKTLGIETVVIDFDDKQDLTAQFAKVVAANPDAVYGPTNTYLNGNRDVLYDLFIKYRLPAMTGAVVDGAPTPFIGVVSYGPANTQVIHDCAMLVDAVLKGTKPGDLAIEQPEVFQLAINTDAAKKIGLAVPASILTQATEVIDTDIRAAKGPAGK